MPARTHQAVPASRSIFLRYFLILLGAYAVWIVLYLITSYIGSLRGPAFDVSLPVDDVLPEIPAFQYVYMLAYVIPLGLLVISREPRFLNKSYLTFIAANAVAFVIFAVAPVEGPVRTAVYTAHADRTLLGLIYSIDTRYNAFPSLHVANPWLVALFAFRTTGISIKSVAFLALAVLISISTVFVRQHYILDVAAGIVLAGAAFAAFSYIRVSDRPWGSS